MWLGWIYHLCNCRSMIGLWPTKTTELRTPWLKYKKILLIINNKFYIHQHDVYYKIGILRYLILCASAEDTILSSNTSDLYMDAPHLCYTNLWFHIAPSIIHTPTKNVIIWQRIILFVQYTNSTPAIII